MPSSKNLNVFNQGRMNRDSDPKVIPDGEYIQMINGRINRSEGSGVGSIENVLGNEAVTSFADVDASVLGAVRDNSTNKIYYFVQGSEEDGVFEFNENTGQTRALLRDNRGTLNFNVDYIITGVNVIGEEVEGEDSSTLGIIDPDSIQSTKLLLWTDGFNPPRKININRTFARIQGELNGFTEQEISVEKNPPLFPPLVNSVDENALTKEEVAEIEKEENLKEKFVRFAYRWKYEDDEYSVFSPFSQVAFRPGKFEIDLDTGAINGMENQIKAVDIGFNTGPREVTEIDLLYKEDGTSTVYVVESFNKKDRKWANGIVLGEIVENQFTADGETNVFVLADTVEPTTDFPTTVDVGGVRLTLDNLFTVTTDEATGVSTLTLAGFPASGALVSVRYKNNAKPIQFSSNKLYRALPDSQLGRVFDNVPIKAKTQELIGNRIVYGNYVDRYDLIDVLKTFETDDAGNRILTNTRIEEIVPTFSVKATEVGNDIIESDLGSKSLKSDRDYELGIVYLDNLGRQTPVLTSADNSVNIPIERANRVNKLSVSIESKAPEWATAYRFFVKQNRPISYNVIPLEYRVQPDDDRWVWFRLSNTDEGKVSEGDYLSLKILGQEYYYREGQDRVKLKIEEVGVQGRNFLEVETPRIGEVTDESTGEVLDVGDAYVAQQAGLWMKIKNTPLLSRYVETETSAIGDKSFARSNNARFADFQPIQGEGMADYKDATYFYPGGNIGQTEVIDETSAVFSETIPVFGGTATNITNAQTGPTAGHGPMRVEVEILEGSKWRYSFWLSPSSASPEVIRQSELGDGRAIVKDMPLSLVNGATVTFVNEVTDYSAGDRFVTTYRYADNFMWGAYKTGPDAGENINQNRYVNPNSTSRYGINARRAHIMIDGNNAFQQGINGRSMVTLGVADGLNPETLEGDPITLPQRRNTFITEDTFYETFEEMLFEEGLYTSGGANKFGGTDRDGDGFGIHQMGFARGIPTLPNVNLTYTNLAIRYAAYLAGGPIGVGWSFLATAILNEKETENYWRLLSSTPADVLNNGLYTFIESGTYNDHTNKRKAEVRMESILNFVQGTGNNGEDLSLMKFAFETQPAETDIDIYYEIGETFPCLNGVHFGNEMSAHQTLKQNIKFDEAGNETQDVTAVPVDLDYFNCYAWKNGIEVAAIRDEFGTAVLEPGAKASTVTSEYQQRENVANLIFSGKFNDVTGVNGLNEFSSSQDALGLIVKQMDTQDGSIQHLFSRNTDLLVFQEDKVNKVLFNKNALFNADGSTNLTAGNVVLGQTTPVAGEFGISQDPESFAVYGNRIYFTDRNRGAVLRLGQNGLTEISNIGMRDYFRTELRADYSATFGNRKPLAIGGYDDYHDQYVLSIREPLTDHSVAKRDKPLNISRQAFLSRTDACRYPEEDIQFIEVYEFFTLTEPEGFQEGDIIYTDINRTSIYQGDNDWFVTREFENDKDIVAEGATVDSVQTFIYSDDHLNSLIEGQPVTMRYNTTSLDATVVSYNRSGNGIGSTVSVRYEDVALVPVTGNSPDAVWEIDVTINSVVNIDNFGVVRRKLNCVGILPPNHDAVRISNSGYNSPEEACGRGIVSRVVYHSGDDATPDIGDSIFDTPYASDEFFEGNYRKGRTQKSGWYQMFDGADFEDYVILIIQGKVEKKRRCAEVMAGRKRVLVSENPTQRRTGESNIRLATRTCSTLPTQEHWHDGEGVFPIAGDNLYQDNFTTLVVAEGFYAMEGGYFIRVNADGVIALVDRCSQTICIEDVVRGRVLDVQNQKQNSWTFQGFGYDDRVLPIISATTPTIDENSPSVMILNGDIIDIGDFDSVTYSWYYAESAADLTERQVIDAGIQSTAFEVSRRGVVPDLTLDNLKSLTDYRVVFVVQADKTLITSEVFEVVTGRTTNPSNTIAITAGSATSNTGDSFTITATVVAEAGDNHVNRWLLNGSVLEGETDLTYTVASANTVNAGEYRHEGIFSGYTTISNALAVTVANEAPTISIALTGNDDPFAGDSFTLTATTSDNEGDVFTLQWYLNSLAIGGETNPTLVTTNYVAMQAGDYTCRVTAQTGITDPVTSNIITITTSLDGTADYNAFTQVPGTLMGGVASGTYSYGEFSEYTPTTGTGPASEEFVSVLQTRTRTTQEIYTGAMADGERTCELVTLPGGRGVAGVCTNPVRAIGQMHHVTNYFPDINRFVTEDPSEANGGIETRTELVPNTDYSVDGTAEYGEFERTGNVTGGDAAGVFTYGEFGPYSFTGTETTTDPYRIQTRIRDVESTFNPLVQDGTRTCNLLTAEAGSGSPGTCTNPNNNIGGTDVVTDYYSEPVASMGVVPTEANGGIEVSYGEMVVNPTYIATATYVLVDATTGGNATSHTIAAVASITGNPGDTWAFIDPVITLNDGFAFETGPVFSYDTDSDLLEGTFSNTDITVTRILTGNLTQETALGGFLVVAGGGTGGYPGAGGLRTSFGDFSGGETVLNNGVQSPAEDPAGFIGGTPYNITVAQQQTSANTNGNDSSIIGGVIDITSLGGGYSYGGRTDRATGGTGGCGGGGKSYSSNLSDNTGNGGPGMAGQGYRGGTGTGRNGHTIGGGGGAGGPGGNPPYGNSIDTFGNRGSGLEVGITGSNYTYSEGGGQNTSFSSNYGSAGQQGIVVIRVPNTVLVTQTNATLTTSGSDNIYTWLNNGTFQVENGTINVTVAQGISGDMTTATLTANAAGGTGSFTYQWFAVGSSTVLSTSRSFSTTDNGDYFCRVTDAVLTAVFGDSPTESVTGLIVPVPVTVTSSGSVQSLGGSGSTFSGNISGASCSISFILSFPTEADRNAAFSSVRGSVGSELGNVYVPSGAGYSTINGHSPSITNSGSTNIRVGFSGSYDYTANDGSSMYTIGGVGSAANASVSIVGSMYTLSGTTSAAYTRVNS